MRVNFATRLSLVILAIAGTIGWVAGQDWRARRQQWDGTVLESYRTRCWLRGPMKPMQPEYRYYNHYWKIRTKEGKTIDVAILQTVWGEAKPGDAVHKKLGERWPQLDSPHARKIGKWPWI